MTAHTLSLSWAIENLIMWLQTDLFQDVNLDIQHVQCYQCLYNGGTLCTQLLLQFYTILFESAYTYVMAWRYKYAQDKILRLSFLFCFVYSVILTYSFHDSSYTYLKASIEWRGT